MRIAIVVVLILVLCSASFAARPDRGRLTPVSITDKGEGVVYWPPNDPVAVQMWEDGPVIVEGPQYHCVWFCLRMFRRIF